MKVGPIVTGIVATLAMGGVVYSFLTASSPYVSIAQAKTMKSEALHLPGQILHPTYRQNFKTHTITFDLKDESGDIIPVVYTGLPPQNIAEVEKVVAIGGVVDGKFHSDKLQIKCPSKYESEKKKQS